MVNSNYSGSNKAVGIYLFKTVEKENRALKYGGRDGHEAFDANSRQESGWCLSPCVRSSCWTITGWNIPCGLVVFFIQNSLHFLEKLRSTELGGWACRVCSNGRLTLGFVWHVPWPEQPLGQYAMAVVARVAAIMILENMI